MSPRTWIMAGLSLLVLAGAVAFMFWPSEPTLPVAHDEPRGDERQVSLAEQLQTAQAGTSVADAGVGELSGEVVGPTGEGVPDAEVWVVAGAGTLLDTATCGVCGEAVTRCTDPGRARELLELVRSGRLERRVLGSTRADHQGHFSLPGMPWSGVMVFARAPGLAEGHQPLEAPEPVAADDDATAAEASPSDVVVELFAVRQARGVVRDEAQAPVPGARVAIADFEAGRVVETTTDAQGHFPISARADDSDSHWVFIEAPGFVAQVLPDGMAEADGELQVTLARPRRLKVLVTRAGVPAEATVTVSSELGGHPRHQRAVAGTAVFDQLSGVSVEVEAEAGPLLAPSRTVTLSDAETVEHIELRAVAQVTVVVIDRVGQPVEATVALNALDDSAAQTDATKDGQVVFEKVPEGTWQLEVTADRQRRVSRRVRVRPGPNAFEISLEPTARLAGRVIDSDGRPVERATVAVLSQIDASPSTATDRQGHFELEIDEAGTYELRASEARHGEVISRVVAPSSTLTLKLEPKGKVVVHVLEGRRPQADVAVYVRNLTTGDTEPMGNTDDQGTAAVAGLASGRYTVSAEPTGLRRPPDHEISVTEGQTTVDTITLERGAQITGRVVDADGRAVSSAQVYAASGDGADTASTDEGGQFSLAGLEPGKSYELRALSDELGTVDAVKASAGSTGVTLRLLPHPRVKGRVVSAGGEVVKAFQVDGKAFVTTDGRFEVATTPYEGRLSLVVTADGFEKQALDHELQADVGDVVMTRARTLEGVVVDASGRGVLGATVSCAACSEPATSGAEGRFTLSGLGPDGAQTITATKGSQRGQAMITGQSQVTVTLNGASHVDGRVLDGSGRPVAARVTVRELTSGDEQKVDANVEGHFELELAEGLYMFITRASGAGQTVRVAGPRVSVTLGAPPGTCAVTVTTQTPVTDAWLLPGEPADLPSDDLDDDRLYDGAVALDLPMAHRPTRAAGLKCGRYTLVATDSSGVRRERVDVRQSESVFVLTAPPVTTPADAAKLGSVGAATEPVQP